MVFRRYDSVDAFASDMLPILLENEVQNNLIISLITDSNKRNTSDWLLATVSSGGGPCLVALLIQPFDLLLYEVSNDPFCGAAELLSRELRRIGCSPVGVTAESSLCARFAEAYSHSSESSLKMTMAAMRLDTLSAFNRAPGFCRMLDERDMTYAPHWERAFSQECKVHVFTVTEITRRLTRRLGKDNHCIWEDGKPVSQAVHGRDTPNGAVINGVYTPPEYRGCGYATSVVGELSQRLLDRGAGFCCLFADASNPASMALYRNLGYNVVCELDVRKF